MLIPTYVGTKHLADLSSVASQRRRKALFRSGQQALEIELHQVAGVRGHPVGILPFPLDVAADRVCRPDADLPS